MKQSKPVLNTSKLIKLIGLDAHIMLCQIKQWLKYKHPCRISYKKWGKVFPFWTFKRYINTKKYLLKNKFIISEYGYMNNKVYTISYRKLRNLISEA